MMSTAGALFTDTFAHKKDDILQPDGFKQDTGSLLLSTFVINILSLALPVMTLQIYDRVLPNEGTWTLPVLIIGVCLAIVLEAMLRLCRQYITSRAGAKYEHLTACRAMDKVLNADLSKTIDYGIGEHLHRMGSVGKVKDFYNGQALVTLAELAFIPVFLGLIYYIAAPLILVPITILSIFTALSFWGGYRLRHALQRREKADDHRFNFLIESLKGVHTLKAFSLEKFFERRYEALEETSTYANYRVTEETAGIFNNGAIFSHLMVTSVISVGAWCVLSGYVTTGGLIATLLLSGRMMQPVQKALGLWARYQDYALARAHLSGILLTPQNENEYVEEAPQVYPEGRLKITDMSFKYQKDEHNFLEKIDLSLKYGDTILISGAQGAGKSTLLNLISGIYPPASGEIMIDGQRLQSFSQNQFIKHVGYIRSEPMIFRGTIRDNVTAFGLIPEAQVQEVARLLEIDRDIAKLPGGFDTFLSGNNTDSIPSGLKQRLSILRVLATKPKLILFDNADRALDKEGYAMIYSFLARLKGKATMILVSEDRNICDLAERHYVMRDGKLIPDSQQEKQGNIKPYQELRL